MLEVKFEIKFEDRVWFKGRSEYDISTAKIKINVSGPRNELFRVVLRHELAHAFVLAYGIDLAKIVHKALPAIACVADEDLATTAGAELYLIKEIAARVGKRIPEDLVVDTAFGVVRDRIKSLGYCVKVHKVTYYLPPAGVSPVQYAMHRAMNEAIANMAGWGVRTPGVAAVYEVIRDFLPPQIVTMIEVATRWPEDLERLTDKQLLTKF